MSDHIVSVKTYTAIFATLLVLLGITIGAAYINMGPFNIVIAISIAVVKGLLIILYFMHVRYSSRLTMLFAAAAFFWLLILIGLLLTDYIPRFGGGDWPVA